MCCSGILKLMMFIFNLSISVVGVAILGIGIWVKMDSSSLFGLLKEIKHKLPPEISQLVHVSYLLIAVGVILVIIGLLGCCGAVRESKCMLLTFFFIVMIIFIIQIVAVVLVFIFESVDKSIFQELEKEVTNTIKNNYGRQNSTVELWDAAMKQFKCCGFNNYEDFIGSHFNRNGRFPDMCCKRINPTDECNSSKVQSANIEGCFDKILKIIKANAHTTSIVVLASLFIELAAMVTSLKLFQGIGDD